MRKLLSAVVALAVGSTIGATAHALTLSTVSVAANADQFLECIVTNLGATPIQTTVTFRDNTGSEISPTFDNCDISVAPGGSCWVQLSANQNGSCTVRSSSSKIRAAVAVYGPTPFPLVEVVAATK